jgi:hypothetical protein
MARLLLALVLFIATRAAVPAQALNPRASLATSALPSYFSVKPGLSESSVKCCIPWDSNHGDEKPQVSEEFSWAGATWQLLLFPSGYGSQETGYSSVFLRLVSDSRPKPLPRGISFTVSAICEDDNNGKHEGEQKKSSRSCAGHVFSLVSVFVVHLLTYLMTN